MNDKVTTKIQVLTQMAKDNAGKNEQKGQEKKSTFRNSLAEHVKTQQQADSFMILLKSLQK